jgi:D-sedoheptulose 7-phosphate isomerase
MDRALIESYVAGFFGMLVPDRLATISSLAVELEGVWRSGRRLYICGNGGSAANASHLANDFNFGISRDEWRGLKVEALASNPAILTCLANDIGYENVFAQQLSAKGEAGDLLLVLSGSGNSTNLVKAIEVATAKGMRTSAILGFDGGICKKLVDLPLHFPIDDMQIAEDLQLIVGHMCMRYLAKLGAANE